MISEFFIKRFWSIFKISFYVMNGSWISREIPSGEKSKCFAWKEFTQLWTWSANTYIVEYVVLCSSDIWTKQLWVYEACQPSMQLCCYRFVCYTLKLVLNQNVMILDPSHYPMIYSLDNWNQKLKLKTKFFLLIKFRLCFTL